MVEKSLKVSDNSVIAIPLRNLIAIIGTVAVAVWGYFGVSERLNFIEHELDLQMKDIELNSEFRIKWPRGEMGSLPADSEQFMLIEHLANELDDLSTQIDEGKAPYDQQQKLTLEFYEKRLNALEENLEKMRNGSH